MYSCLKILAVILENAFQLLCSKVYIQMAPVNFYMKGKCLRFFFLKGCNFTNPFVLSLSCHLIYDTGFTYIERRHATNKKEL